MTETTVQGNEQLPVAAGEEGKYLTFVFLEKDNASESEPEIVGRIRLSLHCGGAGKVIGAVRLWGYEIPVIDPGAMYGDRPTKITDRSCITIFEYLRPRRHFLAIVVEGIKNVMTIAGDRKNGVDWLRRLSGHQADTRHKVPAVGI